MKIFHFEDGKEVVYVQMQDIMYITNNTDMAIPVSVVTRVFGDSITFISDHNRFEFVRFDDKVSIKFFKDLDFIIDFDQYKDLTEEQLEAKAIKLATRINEIAEMWNAMSLRKRKKNTSLYDEYHNLCHKLSFVSEVYAVLYEHRSMPFPEFVNIPK